MNSYGFLAGCYDEFTTDVDYAAWAEYIQRHFERAGLPGSTVLDLACGTGSLTRELSLRGYEMIGVDLSPDMLAQAAEKNRDAEGIAPIFLCQSMDQLDLYGTIDACVCCLDSINYVTDPKKLRRAFQRVHLFLMPGGLFLFDVNTPAKLEGLDGQVFLDETEDAPSPQAWGGPHLLHRTKGSLIMSDHIIRAITADGSVKAVAITGRDLVERARTIHTLLPVATAALGRTLLAASMMGDMLKEDNGALTLQIKGGGPLGTILAVSDCGGNVRGYVQDPHVELMEKVPGKLDVGAAVGTDGSLTVIKDLGLKEPYIGSIGLFSGEIADDIAMYFVESEQIPTACALGVLVDRDQSVLAAGGYLIQLLPGAEEGLIDKIEAGVRRVGSVSHALSRGLDAQGLLEEVLSDFQLEVLETHPVEYRCSCSRERVSRALISMGREELSSLIAEQGQADLSCQFCDKVYHFSKEELEGLLSSM